MAPMRPLDDRPNGVPQVSADTLHFAKPQTSRASSRRLSGLANRTRACRAAVTPTGGSAEVNVQAHLLVELLQGAACL
jgi:hypothetical protein